MRICALKLRNFRSYKNEVEVTFDDFTSIIGRNDTGKSTLLEALEIFFNNDAVTLDSDDPCVHGDSKTVEIGCTFDELPQQLTIDARSETTLAKELLLNRNDKLEILKRFDCRTKTPKEEVFVRALHPNDERIRDLLRLKNADLKVKARDLGCDLANVDERSNVALRDSIRKRVAPMETTEQLIALNEEDGKRIWDQIRRELPAFALFQADRPSKDDDPAVADPMKIAVAAAVKEVEGELDGIKEKVRQRTIEVAERTLAKLREIDPTLAQQLTPSFKAEPKWDGFRLTLTSDDQIPINKRGSGVRRLVLMSFFRAEAERKRAVSAGKSVIYAIEEPESSQHPDNQILLIKTLLALANDPMTQVVITTHVPGVAAMIPVESVRLVTRDEQAVPRIEAGGNDVYDQVVETLGIAPDKRAKVAIFLEGQHDIEFLRHASRLYRDLDGTLPDLEHDHRIAFVLSGGSNLRHWVNHQYLKHAGLKEIHVYDTDDRDAPKYKEQVDIVNARGNGDVAFLTGKREIENYIHADAIRSEFGFEVQVTDWCDVGDLVAERVHTEARGVTAWGALDAETKKKKVSRAKSRLSLGAVPKITLRQLQQMDADGDVLRWLTAIKQRIG